MDTIGPEHPDLAESVKSFCATHRVAYNTASVIAAIESALVQRTVKA